ncbi:MAG: TolC family protein [Planctomycetota bacterium]
MPLRTDAADSDLNESGIAANPVGTDGLLENQPSTEAWGGFNSSARPRAVAVGVPSPIRPGPFRNQLSPYREQASIQMDDGLVESGIDMVKPDAADPQPMWWDTLVTRPLNLTVTAVPIEAGAIAELSLTTSPYVRGLLSEPQIACQDLVIADSQFDPTSFVDAKFTATNDPIGSTLTTGDDATRFRDDLFASSIGVRKLNRGGSNVELVQRGGFQSNNSTFLIPNSQGTSRLELNVTQPLLRDHGRAVNMTRVVLANIDLQLVRADVRDGVESHLVDVTRAYWDLVQARAEYLQRSRLTQAAVELHAILEARGDVDSQRRQVLRADVAIARRQSELVRLRTRIANSQSQLRRLTGSAAGLPGPDVELLPQDVPSDQPISVSTRQAILTALDYRPDIAQSLQQIHAASTRVGAARNQVLPRLDLIVSSYVAGLDSRSDTFGSIGNQFTEGGPSFAAGFVFERPIGNRANQARLQRSRWELNRSVFEFQQTTETAMATVEIAVRETRAAYAELVARKRSVIAAAAEVDYLYQRWRWLPDPNESAILLIEDLLDAQERTAEEEKAVTTAQVAYAMSWIRLRRSMGVLLLVHEGGTEYCGDQG